VAWWFRVLLYLLTYLLLAAKMSMKFL